MSEQSDINYFAYGTPRDPEMIEAIIGREPDGETGTLPDYQMVIQDGSLIPGGAREMLAHNWTPEELRHFESYAIAPKIGELVVGTVWKITDEERGLIDNWELNDGLWYKKLDLDIQTEHGGLVTATSETIDDASLPAAKDLHPDLPLYLADKDRILEIATKVRHEYMARQQSQTPD